MLLFRVVSGGVFVLCVAKKNQRVKGIADRNMVALFAANMITKLVALHGFISKTPCNLQTTLLKYVAETWSFFDCLNTDQLFVSLSEMTTSTTRTIFPKV